MRTKSWRKGCRNPFSLAPPPSQERAQCAVANVQSNVGKAIKLPIVVYLPQFELEAVYLNSPEPEVPDLGGEVAKPRRERQEESPEVVSRRRCQGAWVATARAALCPALRACCLPMCAARVGCWCCAVGQLLLLGTCPAITELHSLAVFCPCGLPVWAVL